MDDATQTPAAPAAPAAPGPLASFARFALCGGGIGVLSSGAVTLLAGSMPWALANAIITVASTLLCTELHARFTFAASHRPGWREHWQSAGSAAAAYAATTAAIFALHLLHPAPSTLTEQITYLGASGLVGTGRFLVLRLVVFTTGRDRQPAATSAATPAPAPAPIPTFAPALVPHFRTPAKATPLPALTLA
ncbi:GtrA family protein [Streptomyces sp. NPDC001868]|uniref:GtrA family protein n=1 Tax=Streptomyces sp. NPDC001868 TaxID=3154401 RepID=UPI00331AB082